MNKHIYDVVLVTYVEESFDKMADNKTFAGKHKHFFWFPLKDIKITDIFF